MVALPHTYLDQVISLGDRSQEERVVRNGVYESHLTRQCTTSPHESPFMAHLHSSEEPNEITLNTYIPSANQRHDRSTDTPLDAAVREEPLPFAIVARATKTSHQGSPPSIGGDQQKMQNSLTIQCFAEPEPNFRSIDFTDTIVTSISLGKPLIQQQLAPAHTELLSANKYSSYRNVDPTASKNTFSRAEPMYPTSNMREKWLQCPVVHGVPCSRPGMKSSEYAFRESSA